MKKVNVALVGATGMVGRTFIKVLEERNFPINNIYMFSSAKSAGTTVKFAGKDVVVEELTETSFDNKDIQNSIIFCWWFYKCKVCSNSCFKRYYCS